MITNKQLLTSNHDDSDAGSSAQLNGTAHFLSRRVKHAHTAHKRHVGLRMMGNKVQFPVGLFFFLHVLSLSFPSSQTHLIVCKLGGVFQFHLLLLQGTIAGGQSQAAQSVTPRPPLLDD